MEAITPTGRTGRGRQPEEDLRRRRRLWDSWSGASRRVVKYVDTPVPTNMTENVNEASARDQIKRESISIMFSLVESIDVRYSNKTDDFSARTFAPRAPDLCDERRSIVDGTVYLTV